MMANILVIQEILMGKCLSVCGNFFLTELLVQSAIKNISNALSIPHFTVLVLVLHFCYDTHFCLGHLVTGSEGLRVRMNRGE